MISSLDLHQLDINVVYRSGGKTICKPDWAVNGYILPYNKLYFVIDGQLIVEIEGRTYLLNKGQMIVIPQAKKHSMRLTEKKQLEKYYFHFTSNLKDDVNLFDIPDLAEGSPVVDFKNDYNKIFDIFQKMYDVTPYSHRLAVLSHLTASFLEIISYYIDKKISNKSMVSDNAANFSSIIEYMSNKLDGSLTLKQIADMTFLSPEHFIRKFKAMYGISPMKYYDRLRVEFATSAIRNSNDSFSNIAKKIGISDICYFSKFFKKHVGISPNEYRKTCHKQQTMYVAREARWDV